VKNYPEYQRASIDYCKQWREKHSAKRLIHLLLKDDLPQ
jgi:hypothetical protein